MKILLSGASGRVGAALETVLAAGRHRIVRLVRGESSSPSEIHWDPGAGVIASEQLEGFDGAVHLGGENISTGRWNAEKKTRIRASRVVSTRLLASTLAGLREPPRVFACASAIGYYGDRGAEIMTEDSEPGSGFLPELAVEWERATSVAAEAGIRIIGPMDFKI